MSTQDFQVHKLQTADIRKFAFQTTLYPILHKENKQKNLLSDNENYDAYKTQFFEKCRPPEL